jgi:hypothetical protein
LYSDPGVALLLNDTAYCQIPSYLSGTYYLVVNHRHSIQTWSKEPIFLAYTGDVGYDFTDQSNKAFGNNLKKVAPDKYAIYTGDVNQDEIIDKSDIETISVAAGKFIRRYNNMDLNGDGTTDAFDLILCDNNFSLEIHVLKP